jgi:DNA polymerase-4/DNA polymerase V
MNPEAKALGITRGMRTRDIRRYHPEVVILPSDYRMYRQYARRMYDIVRSFAGEVEEYSIDECFADLTNVRRQPSQTYEDLARAIQKELHSSLGITFSVGLSVNKVMAKVASKWRKPAGVTTIGKSAIMGFLRDLPIGKIWGIGSSSTLYLRKLGITTALELAQKDRLWISEHCDKPLAEIYEELQGNFIKELGTEAQMPKSIQDTATFYPPTSDPAQLWSELSCHVEDACARLRGQGLLAAHASFFIKTQSFSYIRGEAKLPDLSAEPDLILGAIRPRFDALFLPGLAYRATGISLSGICTAESTTASLFAPPSRISASRVIHETIDRLSERFGKNSVFLGSSLRALHRSEPGTILLNRLRARVRMERALDIIYLGKVG